MEDKTKIAIVTAVCLFALVVILKNVLLIPAETLSTDVILYIIVYSGLAIVYPEKPKEHATSWMALYYGMGIVAITVAIIATNAYFAP